MAPNHTLGGGHHRGIWENHKGKIEALVRGGALTSCWCHQSRIKISALCDWRCPNVMSSAGILQVFLGD